MSENIVRLDENWVQKSMLITDKNFSKLDHRNSMWDDVNLKFTDTTLGGNYAINPPPQFTRFCDIPAPGRTSKSAGMGDYYSRAIDDNSQVVHFRMGEARFNTLANFYSGSYNAAMAMAAKTGRMEKVFFELGRAAGMIVSVMSFKVLVVRALADGYQKLMGAPKSQYFYHTPTMHSYWSAVTTILNQLTVNRGIVPRIGGKPQAGEGQSGLIGDSFEFTPNDLTHLHNMLPDVFRKDGGIDVYAMANRSKRMYRKRQQELARRIDAAPMENFNIAEIISNFENSSQKVEEPQADFHRYIARWLGTDQSKPTTGEDADMEDTEGIYSNWQKAKEFYQAEVDDGGHFASFRVNYTGATQESFSNSVGESEIKGKLNSMSSAARSINFSMAGGNIGGPVGEVINSAKSFIQGTLTELGLGGLAAVGGAAFFDIPKVWEDSVAQMPRMNYTIKLNSPYGNPISQLISIYVPMAMLLAMALPRSTGKQTYTSPFLIEFYDKGRAQSRLGMVDSMSFSRGTSSLGFNSEGHALAIDVNFSIVELTSIMHMPITMGINPMGTLMNGLMGAVGGVASARGGGIAKALGRATVGGGLATALSQGFFDDSSVYSDYLAVLAGMGVNDQIYWSRKLKLALTRNLMNWKSWASISNAASFAGELAIPGRLMSVFYKGVEF